MNVVTYRTKHFEFRVPIDDWNKNKIPLPEGAGAKFIAPSDLTAILLKPFYYDWHYETDGRIVASRELVYDKDRVDQKIYYFPRCKELFEFLRWLKKEHGWYIFTSWGPFYMAVKRLVAIKQGIDSSQVDNKDIVIAFQRDYKLGFSGRACEDEPKGIDKHGGCFWSALMPSVYEVFMMCFGPYFVNYEVREKPYIALSVRCVFE